MVLDRTRGLCRPGWGIVKRRLAWILAGTLLAAAVVLLRGQLWPPERVPVRVEAAARGRVERTLVNSSIGTVHARTRAALTPGASGIVRELNVRRGDRVRRGDVLLRLDAASQSAQLLLAEGDVTLAETRSSRACVVAERAERELARFSQLAHDAIVSTDRLDQLETAWRICRADCEVAAAEVGRARAALALARAELDKTVLSAPFDAIVAEVAVELGEWVTPSVPLMAAPDVIDAIDPSSIYVKAPMDEIDSRLLTSGLVARVTLDSIPERSFPARVTHIAPFVRDVEQQNRTVEVEVELDDASLAATLLPGTSADVEVVLEVHEEVLRIPNHALMEGGRVLVLAQDRIVERRITVGLRNWDWCEVTRGLEPGELVITSLERDGVVAGAFAVQEESEENAP